MKDSCYWLHVKRSPGILNKILDRLHSFGGLRRDAGLSSIIRLRLRRWRAMGYIIPCRAGDEGHDYDKQNNDQRTPVLGPVFQEDK